MAAEIFSNETIEAEAGDAEYEAVAAEANADNETISGEAAWENASLYYSMPLDKDGVRDCKPYILNSELEVLILPL